MSPRQVTRYVCVPRRWALVCEFSAWRGSFRLLGPVQPAPCGLATTAVSPLQYTDAPELALGGQHRLARAPVPSRRPFVAILCLPLSRGPGHQEGPHTGQMGSSHTFQTAPGPCLLAPVSCPSPHAWGQEAGLLPWARRVPSTAWGAVSRPAPCLSLLAPHGLSHPCSCHFTHRDPR